MGEIHIALPCYDSTGNYCKHVAVVMASILDNTTSDIVFYIMHDETLLSENKAKFEELGNSEKSEVKFLNLSGYFSVSSDNLGQWCGSYSKGALFRLVLPEALPDLDKIIYLDADVIVTLDIASLWNIDIGNKSLAAALDTVADSNVTLNKEEIENFSKLGINKERYFCAGVLVMNLAKLRSENKTKGNLLNRIIEYFKKCPLKYPDQDFLNCEYSNDVFYLDTRFNYMKISPCDNTEDSKIWHFAITFKPWVNFSSPVSSLYWKYLLQTPWKNEWCDMLYKVAAENKFYHRHSIDCVKRLLSEILTSKKR